MGRFDLMPARAAIDIAEPGQDRHAGARSKASRGAEAVDVVFNGKFLSSQATGVHRVASELVRAVDQLLTERADPLAGAWRLACPRDARDQFPLSRIGRHRVGVLTRQAWEQLELPRFTRKKLLVGLCNMAPLATQGAITMIHDAHVFLTPESSSWAFNAWYSFALPRIGAAASRIVTVSDFSRDQLVRYGVADAEKIVVIPHGAEHLLRVRAKADVLGELGLRPRGYVLAVANSQRHKNMRLLFDALRSVDLPLVVVGPDKAEAFARHGDRPNDRVIFAGYRSNEELRALYEEAACLAFPSLTEGFGLPPLEAMSLGCPVLATPCGAIPEVCGAAAAYVAPDDVAGWTRRLQQLANPAGERARLSSAGLERAGAFRWRRSAEMLLDLINEVRCERAGQAMTPAIRVS